MKLDVIKELELESIKTSADELERRRIYYDAVDSLILKKFEFLKQTDPSGASNFLQYNPINKAINFLRANEDIEFDTPDAKRYTTMARYDSHIKALTENGYAYTIERMGKGGKSEINEISMLYVLQRRFVKIVENRPVVNSSRSGYNHLLHGDSINELIGSTGLQPKLGKQLAEMCAYSFDPLISELDGAELVSVPRSFDYNHYRFTDGVLNARTGVFTKGDTTTVCMHEINSNYGYSDSAAAIFEQLLDYLATENGQVNPVKRKQILGFMLYPVSYNPIDKDISVLFGSGGNGKSVLGNIMSLAYGSIGTAGSFLKASKKADGSYKNIEITRAFSKNCIRFDEETFDNIEQAEQMKTFIDQKITYEKRDLQSVAVELYIRGVVILNSNTTGITGASRKNTWFTRRFKAMNFDFVFDQDPVAKEWIKMATANVNGIYLQYNQADILSWLMSKRDQFTPQELEHPLPNIADVLTLKDEVDDGEEIANVIKQMSRPYTELKATFPQLPNDSTAFYNIDNVRGAVIDKKLCRAIGEAIGQPKLTRTAAIKFIKDYTDDIIEFNCKSRVYAMYETNYLTPPSKPTASTEVASDVSDDEIVYQPEPSPVDEPIEPDDEVKAILELARLEMEKSKPEATNTPSFELSIITATANGYVSNQTPTDKIATTIDDIVFPDTGNKATMPKIFPDNRAYRGDYSKTSRMMVLDFDHIAEFALDPILDKLKSLSWSMYVQESYNSHPVNLGIHVFIPMTNALPADEWNLYRDMIGQEILEKTGLQFDTGHAGFRGVINSSYHDIIEINGTAVTPPNGLSYLVNAKAKAETVEPWSAPKLTVPMYFGMDNKIAKATKEIFETGDLNVVDGERNSTVFMLANDLVSMENRGAFQSGVFEDLWASLSEIILTSCTSSDAAEFLGVMQRAEKKLEV